MSLPTPTRTPPDVPLERRRIGRRLFLGSSAAIALSTVGGGAWALNRFVVDHVEIDDASAYEAAHGSNGAELDTSNAVLTDDSWSADGTTLALREVTTGSGDATVTYFVADLVLSDATVLRSAFAGDQFGTNITDETSSIAEQNGAIFAINGDYYGFRDTGIVVRNGVVFRDEPARDGLAMYRDGHVEVYDETQTSAQDLVDAGVWNTLSFGPALVLDGEVVDGIDEVEVDTNVGNHSIQGDQPRTAVGMIAANHLALVVVDGRSTGYSAGVSMTELATLMRGLGCTVAYNIDGGGSSTMFFDGDVVNRPSNGGERATSDILYVKA